MGAAIGAAVSWLVGNAGAVASLASAGAAVYSAGKTEAPAQIGEVDTTTTIDKTAAEQAAELEAVTIGGDSDKKKKAGAKSKFKVARQKETTTGVNVGGVTTGVQI